MSPEPDLCNSLHASKGLASGNQTNQSPNATFRKRNLRLDMNSGLDIVLTFFLSLRKDIHSVIKVLFWPALLQVEVSGCKAIYIQLFWPWPLNLSFICLSRSDYHSIPPEFFPLFCFVLSFCGVNVFFNHYPSTTHCLHPSHNHGNRYATVLGKHHYAWTKRGKEMSAMIRLSKPVLICDLVSSALQPWVSLRQLVIQL